MYGNGLLPRMQLVPPSAAFGRNQMDTMIAIMNFLQKSKEVTDKESIRPAQARAE